MTHIAGRFFISFDPLTKGLYYRIIESLLIPAENSANRQPYNKEDEVRYYLFGTVGTESETVFFVLLGVIFALIIIYLLLSFAKNSQRKEIIDIFNDMRENGDIKDLFEQRMEEMRRLLPKKEALGDITGCYQLSNLKNEYYLASAKRCLEMLRKARSSQTINPWNKSDYANYLNLIDLLGKGIVNPNLISSSWNELRELCVMIVKQLNVNDLARITERMSETGLRFSDTGMNELEPIGRVLQRILEKSGVSAQA
jgi:hypothetical protein